MNSFYGSKYKMKKVVLISIVTITIVLIVSVVIKNTYIDTKRLTPNTPLVDLKYNPEDFEFTLANNQNSKEIFNKANQGDPVSQLSIALMYFCMSTEPIEFKQVFLDGKIHCKNGDLDYSEVFGYSINPNNQNRIQEAVKWIKMSADQGNNYAELGLGYLYLVGYGVIKNQQDALKWYQKSAESGNTLAQLALGRIYSNFDFFRRAITPPPNDPESLKWFRLCGEGGNVSCQNTLGDYYYSGIFGASQSFTEAFKWHTLAAQQGNTGSRNKLAEMYFKGKGVSMNHKVAADLFQKNADNEDVDAQYAIAKMYYTGDGKSQDYDEAKKYFLKVYGSFDKKQNKHFRAMFNRRMISDYLDDGLVSPEFYLGLIYYYGQGVVQNYEESVNWFRKSALAENQTSQYNLALMYLKGQGVIENLVQAHKWSNILSSHSYSDKDVPTLREKLANLMTQDQIAEAQKLAQKCISSTFEECD